MFVVGWMVFGFVAGLIARAITPGRDPLGIVATVTLGMAGALVAGWTGQALGLYVSEEDTGFLSATLGATLVLAFYTYALRRARADRIREQMEMDRPTDKTLEDIDDGIRVDSPEPTLEDRPAA